MDRNGEEVEVEENVKEEVGKGWDKKKEDGRKIETREEEEMTFFFKMIYKSKKQSVLF